jgi:hypothetical protein
VELTGLAGDALRDDLGVFVDQNRHVLTSVRLAPRTGRDCSSPASRTRRHS